MPKILLFDIETAPALGFFWEMWETNIIEVQQEGYMLSFSAKWLHDKRVHVHALPDYRGYKANPRDDEKLVQTLHDYISQADIVIAHNGDRFDIKYFNARCLFHGIDAPRPYQTVDTLKIARSRFKNLSNKLDDLGHLLGVGRKLPHTGKHLWLACMNGDKNAWKKMRAYNAQDVKLLEAVYLKLRPWATNHPNVNIISRTSHACPKCGLQTLVKWGYRYTPTGEQQRYKCRECGAWSLGKAEKLDSRITIK